MLCRICGKPMVLHEDDVIRNFVCKSCKQIVNFCKICGGEAENRTENHDWYCNTGVYCHNCREWLVVTSPALPAKSKEELLKSNRENIIGYCLTHDDVYEDYPFHDQNWCVIRHRGNNRIFAWIFERNDQIWVNLKCDPQWTSFWRSAFDSVIPAYHLNKTHWNSVILDGSIPDEDVHRMVKESYELTK